MVKTALTHQERAQIEIVSAIGLVIKELGEVPSGHLYARVMGHLTLEQYTRMIEALKHAGLVTEKSHLLTWTGPR